MSCIDFGFDSLRKLHESVNELLHSPATKLEIIHHGDEKWAHQVSEAALKMADSSAAAKDLLLLSKDHLQCLQSVFRRGDPNIGNNIAACRLPRKQLKKAILRRLDSLNGTTKNMCIVSSAILSPPSPEGQSLKVVVNMLKEVRATILLIVRTLLSLITMPSPEGKQNYVRKDPLFRLKLTRVDSLSFWEKCTVSDVRTVTKRLEEMEVVVDEMEAELERMFRRLIRTRASLLNILTT